MTKVLNKSKKTDKINPKTVMILKHEVFIFLIFSILVSIVCGIIYAVNLSQAVSYYFSVISIAVFSFISGYLSGRKYKKNGIAVGILFNMPALLVCSITSLSMNSFDFDYRLIVTVFLLLLFSAVGGIVGVNTRVRSK